MNPITSNTNVSICFHRRQFSLCLCFAMTVDKKEGQTLVHVRLYISRAKLCINLCVVVQNDT
jgi:hypothetical protein